MKFSKQLCASADLRYLQAYIAYKDLKKAIKLITGADVECCTVRDVVSNFGGTSALTGSIFRPPESRFQDLLNLELEKINDFSRKKACEVLLALDNACSRVEALRRSLLEEHAARPSDASAGAAVHPCAPAPVAESSLASRAEPAAAAKHAFASDSAAQREQQLASDHAFPSPAVSERSSSSSSSSNSCTRAKNGAEPDGRVEEEQGDSRRDVFSSSTGVRSTSGGFDSKLNDVEGSNTEAVGGASSFHAHKDRTSFSSRGNGRGGEKSISDESSEKTEEEDGKRRRRLHATEQQEREAAAELLRVQQQLMELEGILDGQSEEVIFLDSYVRLNFTGFRKITKKYDKHNGSAAASWYMHRVVKQDFMKINFTLLLAKLASGYDALADAAQIFQQQQNRAFDILLSEPGSDYNEGGEGKEEGSCSSSRKGHRNSSNSASDSSNDRSSSSSSGTGTRSGRRDTAGGEESRPRTKHADVDEGNEDQQKQTILQGRGQQLRMLAHSSVSSVAAHAWTPLQHAAEECASDPQGGRVKCLKYLVPPDMLMRVKTLVLKRYPLLAIHGLPVSLFANGDTCATAAASGSLADGVATASVAGAALGARTKGLSRSSSLGDPSDKGRADKCSSAAENIRSLLQVTPGRRSRSHRSTTLFDPAGGAAARAASWRVYLDDSQLSFYTAALSTCPQSSWGSDYSTAVPAQPTTLLLPRVRWHGQTTSLASPLSRVALDLCRVDESSASIQEDITQTYESNSPGQQCPPRTVVLQQRQLLELLRGEVSSEALLQVLLKESEGDRGQSRDTPRAAGAPGGGKRLSGAAGLEPDAVVVPEKDAAGGSSREAEAHAAEKEYARVAATGDGGERLLASQRRAVERRAEVQRVLDFISAAVQRQHISPCLRARFYRTQYRSRSGLVSVSIDEDIRFSRELGKSVPSSQWLRSENEALATDDVQPFPWGVLDISFIVPEEQQQRDVDTDAVESSATSAASLGAGSSTQAFSGDAGTAADSSDTPTSLKQTASAMDTANEDLQDFLARVNSLSDVILVRGFSLFLHGIAALYTDRLQEKQLQEVKQEPEQRLAIGGEEQQAEISGDALEMVRANAEQLLPHWLQYTVAMERQEENKTPATQRQSARLRENRDDSSGVVIAAAASASSGNNYDEKVKSRVETTGGGEGTGAGAGGGRRSNLIDVVHKGTSASLVHEWQATLEEEQSALNELSAAFVDRSSYRGVEESAVSTGPAAATRVFDGVPRTEGRNGMDDYFSGLPSPALGNEAAQPTPHQEGLRQPLLTQTRGYAAAEQETASRSRGSSLPVWLQRCGRHWLRCCTKKICCFPWTNRRSARRLQQLRGGAGGAPVGAWGGGIEVGGAVPTAAAVRVEPKTFFANERTLLQWMNTAVLIATISITLMNFGSPIGRIAGLIMSPVAVFFIGYSFWVYLRRARALERKEPINYNDKLGPTVLVITLMCSLSVVILLNVLYGGEESPTTSATSASPELERPASHMKNHSKYSRTLPSVLPESQNEDVYDEENLQSHSMFPFEHSPERPRDSSSKKALARETTAFYRYPVARVSSGRHPSEQRIAEAELHAPRGSPPLDTTFAVASDSVGIPGDVLHPVDNPTGRKNAAAGGNGLSDTEDAAAALRDSGVQQDKIQGPGLRSRIKMMKAAVGQKESVRAFSGSELQIEFEAAGRMPTHSPNQNISDSMSV